MKLRFGEDGFTLPELISVIVVSSLFVGLILVFGISYWRYSALLEADLDTLVTRLNAGDFIRESVGSSSGLIIQNSIVDSHTQNPDPAFGSGNYWIPIHAIPNNLPVGLVNTTSPLLYYRRYSIDNSNALIMNGVQPYEDEFILYLNGTTKQLMLRALANPNASGNKLKTSCPSNLATLSCPADKVIADNIISIDRRYFSRTGNLIDWTSVYDSVIGTYAGPDFTVVDVLELTLNISKKPVFQTTNATQNSTIIRIALRNT